MFSVAQLMGKQQQVGDTWITFDSRSVVQQGINKLVADPMNKQMDGAKLSALFAVPERGQAEVASVVIWLYLAVDQEDDSQVNRGVHSSINGAILGCLESE